MKLKGYLALAMSAICSIAHAQFESRNLNGDGVVDAIYDAEHNLTWLRDANYYASTGLPPDTSNYGNVGEELPPGVLRWNHARTFVDGLTLGGVDDWRMPTRIVPPGYNDAECPIRCLQTLPSRGPSEYSFIQGVLGMFDNVAAGVYLTNSPDWNWELLVNLADVGNSGFTDEVGLLSGHTMVVRAGDTGYAVAANGTVTPVPEPSTWALMIAGLIGVGVYSRKSLALRSSR